MKAAAAVQCLALLLLAFVETKPAACSSSHLKVRTSSSLTLSFLSNTLMTPFRATFNVVQVQIYGSARGEQLGGFSEAAPALGPSNASVEVFLSGMDYVSRTCATANELVEVNVSQK